MNHSGVSARDEPRKVVNRFVPRPLLREPAQNRLVKRALQWAIPDLAYEDPEDLAIILTTADKESLGKLRATSTNDSCD